MTAPEPVVLTDGEREALHDSALRRVHDLFAAVECILADRLAADRAAHEALREAVEAALRDPKNGWWHTGGTRCVPLRAIRAALAAAAPTPPQDAATEGGL